MRTPRPAGESRRRKTRLLDHEEQKVHSKWFLRRRADCRDLLAHLARVPAVVQVEEVRDGGFLSGGKQEIAIVQRIDQQQGQVIVSATRQPNTPGVNGSGTLLGLVVRAVAPGKTALQILQVNARNSQQQTIPMVSGEAAIEVP